MEGEIMKVERVSFGEYRANSYLVIKDNLAVLFDASLPIEKLENILTKNNAKLDCVFITHAHFDHMLNLNEIAKKYSVKIYIHHLGLINMQDLEKNMSTVSESPFVVKKTDNFVGVRGGDKITCLGDEIVECFETPGHCESSMCFKLTNIIFTGDTLFYGTCGRCDLWDSSVEKMKSSLKMLGDIPNIETCYPGHGYSVNNNNLKATIDYCVNQLLN